MNEILILCFRFENVFIFINRGLDIYNVLIKILCYAV
jgi:hypothetical protein